LSKGTVIIGVGGGGRGAVNWVKYFLEQKYGSYQKRGVKLLVIDGPETEPQYILPGNFQIDARDDSPEFIRLKKSPDVALDAIDAGKGEKEYKYINQWLSNADAERLPRDVSPETGYGGERVLARAGFFIEVSALNNKIRQTLNSARGLDEIDPPLNIFVVGSLAGGTGSGMYYDVCHLVKKLKGNDNLYGIILLPKGFEQAFSNDLENARLYRDAKSFAGIRELLRYQSASPKFPTRIAYEKDIKVENGQLFDMAFLVDGTSEGQELSDKFPWEGVSAKSAELMITFVEHKGSLQTDLNNLITRTSAAEGHERFATFGVHTYTFTPTDIIDTFAHRLALEIYRQMTNVPEGKKDEGQKLARQLLQSDQKGTNFGRMLVNFLYDNKSPLLPPIEKEHLYDYQNIHSQHMNIGSGDPSFPPEPDWEKEVPRKANLFTRNNNEAIISICDSLRNATLGMKDSTEPQDVRGWINYQVEEIAQKFKKELVEDVWNQFYNENAKRFYKLSEKPYTIALVRDYLVWIQQMIDRFEKELDRIENRYLKKDNIVDKQRNLLIDIENKMDHQSVDVDKQEIYITESEFLLRLEIWESLIEGCKKLLDNYKNIWGILWAEVGTHASGWLGHLSRCEGAVKNWENELITKRREIDRNTAKDFLPTPMSRAEQELYKAKVRDKAVSDEILASMEWTLQRWEKKQRLQLQDKPFADDLEQLGIILNINVKEDSHIPDITTSSSEYDVNRLREHNPGEFVKIIVPYLRDLEKLSIWDALQYEYTATPQDIHKDFTVDEFVEDKVIGLSKKSNQLVNTTTAGNASTASYVFSSFLDKTTYDQGSMEHVATEFYRHTNNRNMNSKESAKSYNYVTSISITSFLNLFSWGYFKTCMNNYFSYVKDSTHPIHLDILEKKAADIEDYYCEEISSDASFYLLDYRVVRFLQEGIRDFSFVLLMDLLEDEKTVEDRERFYYNLPIKTKRGATKHVKVARETDDIVEMLQTYFDPAQSDLRQWFKVKWDNYFKSKSSTEIKEEMENAIDEIDDKDIKCKEENEFNLDDFKIVIKVLARQYIDRL